MSADAIAAFVDDHRAEHLDLLKQFLRFPSISAQSEHDDDCLACAEWLAGRFAQIGLDAHVETELDKPAVMAAGDQHGDRPTLLVYGHYDVQPPDPLELWDSDPFQPTVEDDDLIARGASDDKGPLLTWLLAAEAHQRCFGDLPVNLKFLVEGEEEIGSPSLGRFIAANTEMLACDAVAISDTTFYAEGVPSITYGLRGLTYFEVTLTAADHDLHSGLYGGLAINPLHAMAALIESFHDAGGRIAVEGFYDDVLAVTDAERAMWDRLGFDGEAWMAEMGAGALGGAADVGGLDRLWALPSLDCHGIAGGYVGEGPKTVIPAEATAKFSVRLAPGQTPSRVKRLLEQHIRSHCPPGVRVGFKVLCAEDPWLMDPTSPTLAAAKAAMTEAFGADCALIRCGASVPVTIRFHKHLGVDPLMMGFSLSDDRFHSPNERFRISHFHRGIIAGASLMRRLGAEYSAE